MEQQTAQPTEPVKVPATVAAVEARDFGKFREASLAQRAGKPLPDVERPTETKNGDSTEAGRALNANQRRRAREQQRINEQIRAGVEAATKAKDEEIAALRAKAESAPKVAATAPVVEEPPTVETPPEKKTPEYKRYAAMADAPKVAEFDSLDEHAAAMALFIADKRDAERAESTKTKTAADERTARLLERDKKYCERIAPDGDLSFVNSLHPDVKALVPVESLPQKFDAQGRIVPAAPVTALNFLASKIVESEHAKALLQHFTDEPKELGRFAALPTPDAVLVEFGRLVGRLDTPKAPTPRPKLVSDASPPVTQVGTRNAAPSDPVLDAVKKRNFRAFREAQRAKEQAKRAS